MAPKENKLNIVPSKWESKFRTMYFLYGGIKRFKSVKNLNILSLVLSYELWLRLNLRQLSRLAKVQRKNNHIAYLYIPENKDFRCFAFFNAATNINKTTIILH